MRRAAIIVAMSFDDLVEGNAHRRTIVDSEGGRRRLQVLKRRDRLCCGFLDLGDAVQLLHPEPDDVDALVSALRYVEIPPDLLRSAPFSEEDVPVDLEDLRARVAYPFPDDPNAEVCVITGQRAYARRHASPPSISGWYGSTIADMASFVVVDPSLPVGPLSDSEIEKALGRGRIVRNEPLSREEIMALPQEAVEALIDFGIEQAEEQFVEGRMGDIPVLYRSEDDDFLALPFVEGLSGRRGDGKYDLAGIGSLMAVLARARGLPYDPDERRQAAVRRMATRISAVDPVAYSLGIGP